MGEDHTISTCLSETTIAGFLEHRLPAHEIDALEAHIDRCVICRLVLAELARTLPTSTARASDHATDVRVLASADAGAEHSALPHGTAVGRFVVLDVLGVGGIGIVYAAYDPELNRNVALKLLHGATELDGEAPAGGQLRSEAMAMARIQHANVVTVHEVGTFRGQVFIAMEQVEGAT